MSKTVLQALVQKQTDCVWGEEGLNTWKRMKRTRKRETSESVKRDFKANISVPAQELSWCGKCRLLRTSFTSVIRTGKGIRSTDGLECLSIAGHQLTSTHTPPVCQHKEHCKRTYNCVTVNNERIRLSFIHTSKAIRFSL